MDTPGGGVSIRLRRGPGEIGRTGSDNFERRGGGGGGVGVFCGGGVSLGWRAGVAGDSVDEAEAEGVAGGEILAEGEAIGVGVGVDFFFGAGEVFLWRLRGFGVG